MTFRSKVLLPSSGQNREHRWQSRRTVSWPTVYRSQINGQNFGLIIRPEDVCSNLCETSSIDFAPHYSASHTRKERELQNHIWIYYCLSGLIFHLLAKGQELAAPHSVGWRSPKKNSWFHVSGLIQIVSCNWPHATTVSRCVKLVAWNGIPRCARRLYL